MFLLDGSGEMPVPSHSEVVIQLSEGGDSYYEELQLNDNLIGQ